MNIDWKFGYPISDFSFNTNSYTPSVFFLSYSFKSWQYSQLKKNSTLNYEEKVHGVLCAITLGACVWARQNHKVYFVYKLVYNSTQDIQLST